jgi:hypothetical protein
MVQRKIIGNPLGLKKVLIKKTPVITQRLSLPTEKRKPEGNLGAYTWLIYGQKKIGKTTLASLFPDTLFFMFEPGGKALNIYRLDITKWEDALEYLSLLEKDKKNFKTVVVDTGFEAYQSCMNYVCKKNGIEYPREDNFGKDWAAIKTEFRSFQNRIMNLGLGFIVLCHEKTKEQSTFTGQKYDQICPLLSNPADDYYRAVIDNVCWLHYRGKQRFLQIKGTEYAMAGIALQANEFFITPKGEQVYAVPISNDPKGGYQSILAAFQNKQEQTFKMETEEISKKGVVASIQKKVGGRRR